jgi:pimeloyl-ACP methyl ester carboxylesterase
MGYSWKMSISLCLLSWSLFAAVNATVVIPHPNGTYGVGLSIGRLTDTDRMDPYNTKQHRNVVLSAFYPIGPLAKCDTKVVDYMPPATAQIQDEFYAQYGLPNGSFERLRLSLCRIPQHTKAFPLLVFSPGLGNSRLIYSALAQSIASNGYTVITIDHPYDANIVEYPDGTLVSGANITTNAQIEQALAVRVKDVSFVLDVLSHLSGVRKLIPSAENPLNTTHAVVAGHSLGGATAAQAMLADSRLIGGINLDGTFFGSVLKKGLDRPFLIFGHKGKNQSTDTSWKALWRGLKGWRRELELMGSQHATFSDLPVLIDVLGLRAKLPGADQVLGTIGGERARKVVSTYVVKFVDFVRGAGGQNAFNEKATAFSEVVVIAR